MTRVTRLSRRCDGVVTDAGELVLELGRVGVVPGSGDITEIVLDWAFLTGGLL